MRDGNYHRFVFRVPTYKFFGPHLGALYGRYDLLDRLRAYKVRPAWNQPPHKFETGTKNHEGLAGTTAAINYLADLGAEFGAPFADQFPGFEGRRLHLKMAMAMVRAYERPLVERLIAGLKAIPGVTVYGIADPARFDQRAPTVAFRLEGYTPRQAAERLGGEGVFVWDGNYYALAVTERLGVEESGGMVRVGTDATTRWGKLSDCYPWLMTWLGSEGNWKPSWRDCCRWHKIGRRTLSGKVAPSVLGEGRGTARWGSGP